MVRGEGRLSSAEFPSQRAGGLDREQKQLRSASPWTSTVQGPQFVA
jgi:hypothetical protein